MFFGGVAVGMIYFDVGEQKMIAESYSWDYNPESVQWTLDARSEL